MKKNLLKVISVILCLAVVMTGSAFMAFADETAPDEAPFRISVTMNGDASTQRGFCWYTKANVDNAVKIYDELGAAVAATVTYEEVIEWDGNYCHQAVVSGLEAGKTYFYTIGNDKVESPVGTFETDDGNDSFNFIAIADVQASSDENFAAAAKVVEANGKRFREAAATPSNANTVTRIDLNNMTDAEFERIEELRRRGVRVTEEYFK